MMQKILVKFNQNKKEIKTVIFLFLGSRVLLTFIGVVSYILFEPSRGYLYDWNYSKYLFLDIWGIWDSGWYLNIAYNWYPHYDNFNLLQLGQTNFNFFPLYPFLIKVVGVFTFKNYFISGLLVSNFFLFVSCLYLFKIASLDSDKKTSLKSVVYLFLAPASFVLSGVFTESLFLALTLMVFYYARVNKWALAGIFGFFLALTKSLGVLVFAPVLFMYLKEINFSFKKIRPDIIYLLFLPLGLFSFSLLNYVKTGDFLAFAHSQQLVYGHKASNVFMVIVDGLLNEQIAQKINSAFTILLVFLLFVFYKKIKIENMLFSLIIIFAHLFSGNCMNSMFRYSLIIFPLYILFAQIIKNKYLELTVIASLILIQCVFMIYWVNGFWLII